MILKNLINVGFREMSRQLALCELYQCFCRVQRVPVVRAPSKSTLNDYAKWLEQRYCGMKEKTQSNTTREVCFFDVSC